MDQILNGRRAPPRRGGHGVPSQAPSGVKRHPETMHRPPMHQGLKPDQRGDRIDRRSAPDQPDGMASIIDDPDAWMVQRRPSQPTRLAMGAHIGMNFDQHIVVGPVLQRGLQHGGKTRPIAQPHRYRQIAMALIGNQNIAVGQRAVIFARMVIFGQAVAPPQSDQRARCGPDPARLRVRWWPRSSWGARHRNSSPDHRRSTRAADHRALPSAENRPPARRRGAAAIAAPFPPAAPKACAPIPPWRDHDRPERHRDGKCGQSQDWWRSCP